MAYKLDNQAPVKSGVNLFKTKRILTSADVQTKEIVKTIFSQLMFIIQTEKKIIMMVGVKLMNVLQEWQIHYCRNQMLQTICSQMLMYTVKGSLNINDKYINVSI